MSKGSACHHQPITFDPFVFRHLAHQTSSDITTTSMLRALKPPRISPTSRGINIVILPRTRLFTSSTSSRTSDDRERYDPRTAERVQDEVDVCIVGAGPAGLSAAIRLKQLEKQFGKELRVIVLEKASEVGECHSCHFHPHHRAPPVIIIHKSQVIITF